MAETKYTDGAVRAALKLFLLSLSKPDQIIWADVRLDNLRQKDYELVDKYATIIDQETGLPEMQSRIDHLKDELKANINAMNAGSTKIDRLGAEKKELLRMLKSAIIDIDDWNDENGEFDVTHEGLRTLRQEIEKAIAKADPPTTTNPKPESGENKNP